MRYRSGEQLTLGAVPRRDALTQVTVERAEVRLDLTAVGQQLPCRRGELLVAVTLCRRVEHRHVATLGLRDLDVDLAPAASQFGEADRRIVLGAVDDLTQQSNNVFGRDSVPTNERTCSMHSHDSAVSTAGVTSKCGSSGAGRVDLRSQPSSGLAQSLRCSRAGLGNVASPRRWLSADSSSSTWLMSSAAATDRALPSTNTRCRKLSTSGALSARSSRHAALCCRRKEMLSYSAPVVAPSMRRLSMPPRRSARETAFYGIDACRRRWSRA
jgi:hypothetical protein